MLNLNINNIKTYSLWHIFPVSDSTGPLCVLGDPDTVGWSQRGTRKAAQGVAATAGPV